MSEKPAIKISLNLLVLDGIGSILFGLGLAKLLAGLDILPVAFQFDKTGWTMLLLGLLCMLPFMLNFLGQVRARTEGRRFK